MPNNGTSYDFANFQKRDLSTIYTEVIQNYPSLLSLIPISSVKAKSTKYEWVNDEIKAKTFKLTTVADGNGTTFVTDSTDGLVVGQRVRFESSAGATRAGTAKIATVANATTFTITRTGLATLSVNDIMKVVSKAEIENSLVSLGEARIGEADYNYTQIFSKAVPLSATLLASEQEGDFNTMNKQILDKIIEMNQDLQSQILYGVRDAGSKTSARELGGLLNDFMTGSLNINSTGGALTPAHINDVLSKIYASGIRSNELAIVCNTNQARKISAFNSTANPLTMIQQGSKIAGGAVYQFQSDLPINQGLCNIVVDTDFPKDQVLIFDLSAVELVDFRGLIEVDATVNGQDGQARRIIRETTVAFQNAKLRNGLITGLTV